MLKIYNFNDNTNNSISINQNGCPTCNKYSIEEIEQLQQLQPITQLKVTKQDNSVDLTSSHGKNHGKKWIYLKKSITHLDESDSVINKLITKLNKQQEEGKQTTI